MIRRSITVALFVIISSLLISEQKIEEPKGIQKKGVLTVGICKRDTFPMFYVADGTLTGHEIDLAKLIAAELGVSVRFDRSAATFDDVISLVAEKKVDVGISMLSVTSQRALKVRFSNPYICLHPVLIENRVAAESVKSGDKYPIYASESRGTAYTDIVKHLFPGVAVYETATWENALDNTVRNISQICIRDEIGAYTAVDRDKRLLLRLKLTPLYDRFDYISIAVARDCNFFVDWLNVFLQMHGYPKKTKEILDVYSVPIKEKKWKN